MTCFTLASEADKALLAEVMQSYHGELTDKGVRVAFILASRSDFQPAVTHGGYPALATIRIIPLKDRLLKGYDAELLVSQREYEILAHQGKQALLDHELSRLELWRNKKPPHVVEFDDIGRPKLKKRKGDWNAGDGFAAVVARHGEHAIEFENLRLAFGRAKAAAEDGEVTNGH